MRNRTALYDQLPVRLDVVGDAPAQREVGHAVPCAGRALRLYPLAVDRTVVECDWLFLDDVVAAGKDLSRSVELFDRVNRQDFAACERCQPAMGSRLYAKGGVLVPSEHHIGAFHDWVRDRPALRRPADPVLSPDSPVGG